MKREYEYTSRELDSLSGIVTHTELHQIRANPRGYRSLIGRLALQCAMLMDKLERKKSRTPRRLNGKPLSYQCRRVLWFLSQQGDITCYDSLKLGIGHLPRRILDLKEHGYQITTEMVRRENAQGKIIRIAKYSLVRSPDGYLEKSSPRGPS